MIPSTDTAIIIPAFNEEATIESCITHMLDGSRANEFRIIVACNGCTDRTAAIVADVASRRASVASIDVVDLPQPGKTGAMNAALDLLGEHNSSVLFVDADSTLSADVLRRVGRALDQPSVLAASTRLQVDTTAAGPLSAAYHRYWSKVPSIKDGLAGRGIYGLSNEGLERLGRFPNIMADDRYIDVLFSEGERQIVDAASTVAATASIGELLRRKIRIFAGNEAIASEVANTSHDKLQAFRPLMNSKGRALGSFLVYAAVNALAKATAKRRSGATHWSPQR